MDTRSFEKIFIIDAPREDVWRALTEADEITKWFSTDADVTPEVGGEIYLAWNEDFKGTSTIEIWDPPNHLRHVDHREAWQASNPDAPAAETPSAVPLTVDYHLSTEQGKTVLRLVHSGFGTGEEWDEEFDSIKRGWGAMMLNLRTYLELHPGEVCRRSWQQFQLSASAEKTWEQFCQLSGLPVSGIREGTRLPNPTSDAELSVDLVVPGYELGLAVGERSEELIRLSLYPTPDGCLAWLDHLAYNISPEEFKTRNQRWRQHYRVALEGQ